MVLPPLSRLRLAFAGLASALCLGGPARLPAEPARVFPDPREAIAHAREGDRLLLFLLADPSAGSTEALLAAVTEELGLENEDLGDRRVPLVPRRAWTFADGAALEAALLEAKGETGIFLLRYGTEVERAFRELSAPDLALLARLLNPEG